MKSILFILLICLALMPTQVSAQAQQMDQVSVKVEGLGCPFCAFGLEKKMKTLDGAQQIQIDVETGMMQFSVPMANRVTEAQIDAKVSDAGYTAKHIEIIRAEPMSVTPRTMPQTSTETLHQMVEDHSTTTQLGGFCCQACKDANCPGCLNHDPKACVSACTKCHKAEGGCGESCSGNCQHGEGQTCSGNCQHGEGQSCCSNCQHDEGQSCSGNCQHGEGQACSGNCQHGEGKACCSNCQHGEGQSCSGNCQHGEGQGCSNSDMGSAQTSVSTGLQAQSIPVSGKCGMCKSRIERAVNRLEGVKNAVYDLDSQTLQFQLEGSQTTVEQVRAAVVAAGHDSGDIKVSDAVYQKLPPCCKYRN